MDITKRLLGRQVAMLRGMTGGVRIVPFMFAFYALLAGALPCVTDQFMTR